MAKFILPKIVWQSLPDVKMQFQIIIIAVVYYCFFISSFWFLQILLVIYIFQAILLPAIPAAVIKVSLICDVYQHPFW